MLAVTPWRHYNLYPHGSCSHEAITFVYVSLQGICSGEC